jgi:predicted AAA+ superfamily ATPase
MAVPGERVIDAADINRVTFQAYDAMLRRAHISVPAPAWQTNRLKRLTSFPKRFTADAALAQAIAGVGESELSTDPALAGHFLESFVAQQLRPELEVRRGGLYHVRTRAGEREVDLVAEIEGRLIALEVKHAVRPKLEDASHLAWFANSVGDRLAAALVLHRGTATYELAPGVWAVPIASMWG